MPLPFAPIVEKRAATSDGAILFDAARIPQVEPELLAAERWPTLDRHGRGAVHRVEGSFGRAVLRTYRRGGLIARFNRDRYLWSGEDRTRPFREFRLLAQMRAQGLPVPAPLAAGFRRSGTSYRASILTAEVPDVTTLADQLPALIDDTGAWEALGSTLARFHAAGFWHADMNAHNLLLDGQRRWWLIDFDRGEQRAPDTVWPQTRLARLQRSLYKLGAAEQPGWQRAWRALCGCHDRDLRRWTTAAGNA